ncbi:MAG: helix-turn-helix domain-containing protein [Clostridiales bacterium]|jgi:transcriptional regulator with XRE-family HTH domain|nr:helix-turn-helix domain-containing protein [Clostridiales bacterium]
MKSNKFGQTLKELRIAENLSQKALGEIFFVCNQTISFWETGSREPDMDTLVMICNYFKVSADYMLGMTIL